jgi:hypothetical protein
MSTSISTSQIFSTSVTVHFCIAISRRGQRKLIWNVIWLEFYEEEATALNEIIYRRNTLSSLAVISLLRDEKRIFPLRNILSPCQIGLALVTPTNFLATASWPLKLLSVGELCTHNVDCFLGTVCQRSFTAEGSNCATTYIRAENQVMK